MNFDQILLKPLITERSLREASLNNYTFLVDKHVDKKDIVEAVKRQFKVYVTGVRTVMMRGKKRMVGKKRTAVKARDYKKAIVSVKAGEKIDLFTVEGTEAKK
ncbi:MAG: 50S ribosomal protein L23 [Candidatus Gottesmanbacteria bacterium GW2011_GWA2_41_12]|uniref:Large ribosomal subunit protein uL23 n=2 Tax=Candidatus Gottesmaniibacteriota TaxID=1752720 RepID=A0A0G0XLE4_9BACT|nr:MAG: 50S ribosomal protein L23 [Candidatus Gottesmanbacteria bacterium GW2011_GWC2_39_8]KKR88517.1 MAG: 50S ribosomal protein L23 [Candidatus Gottesmanbacteria bacterium GW2011_GWA2_41_12]